MLEIGGCAAPATPAATNITHSGQGRGPVWLRTANKKLSPPTMCTASTGNSTRR